MKFNFRAWLPSLKWMCEVTEISYEFKNIDVFQIGDSVGCTEMIIDFDDAILMQSTSLKDKNQTEIFEGDIVEFEVANKQICGLYEVRRSKSGEWRIDNEAQGRSLYVSGAHNCKVVGSIYENPELLEV